MKINLVLAKTDHNYMTQWTATKVVEVEIPLKNQAGWQVVGAEWPEDDEAIEINHYLEAENALLRKVEEVGEILWSEAICHRCNARECRGCAAHDFKRALSEYQSWKEGQI